MVLRHTDDVNCSHFHLQMCANINVPRGQGVFPSKNLANYSGNYRVFLRSSLRNPDLKWPKGNQQADHICRRGFKAGGELVHQSTNLPSLKLTYLLKMLVFNKNLHFQGSTFRGYVSFREGSWCFIPNHLKNMRAVKLDHLPNFQGENEKTWNHHLATLC